MRVIWKSSRDSATRSRVVFSVVFVWTRRQRTATQLEMVTTNTANTLAPIPFGLCDRCVHSRFQNYHSITASSLPHVVITLVVVVVPLLVVGLILITFCLTAEMTCIVSASLWRRWWHKLKEIVAQVKLYLIFSARSFSQTVDSAKRRPMPNVMAALLSIGGALCWTSQSLADAHWSSIPCSNAANIEERKIWTQSEFCTCQNSVRGARAPASVYIVYQPRRRPNIVQSLVDFRWWRYSEISLAWQLFQGIFSGDRLSWAKPKRNYK